MNRLFLYMIIIAGFSSCHKDYDNNVFDQSPDQRLNETLSKYQSALISAPYGWKATIVPGSRTIYNFYFKFDDKNRVKMFSDFDTTSAGTQMESSYRLKALQQPVLIFDTYSYIHQLANPDPRVNGGTAGQGLQSDFEFAIDTVTDNMMRLTGRMNGTQVTLIKATQQEQSDWENGLWARSLAFENIDNILQYFKRLVTGGQQFDIIVDNFGRIIQFTWVDNSGNIRTAVSSFVYSPNGILLTTPFNSGTQTISGFSNIVWNETANSLSLTVNNTTSSINGVIKPIKVDTEAPKRWWQYAVDRQTYWASLGFTVNGVFDAYRITSVSDFLVYWPEIGTNGGGITIDLLGFVANSSIEYGPSFRPPTFTADGRVVFGYIETLGTVPAAATNAVNSTLAQMTIPEGYYLIQTGATSYDMVSAKDAKSWITWLR